MPASGDRPVPPLSLPRDTRGPYLAPGSCAVMCITRPGGTPSGRVAAPELRNAARRRVRHNRATPGRTFAGPPRGRSRTVRRKLASLAAIAAGLALVAAALLLTLARSFR